MKTHCKRGHALVAGNVYYNHGRIACKICRAATVRKYRGGNIAPQEPQTAFPESEYFARNLARLKSRDDEAWRAAYLLGVEMARGEAMAERLRAALEWETA